MAMAAGMMLRMACRMMLNSESPLARSVWMKSWLRTSESDERVVRRHDRQRRQREGDDGHDGKLEVFPVEIVEAVRAAGAHAGSGQAS